MIVPEIESGLFGYIHGIIENNKSKTEFRGLLKKYQVEYDERYVWD